MPNDPLMRAFCICNGRAPVRADSERVFAFKAAAAHRKRKFHHLVVVEDGLTLFGKAEALVKQHVLIKRRLAAAFHEHVCSGSRVSRRTFCAKDIGDPCQ